MDRENIELIALQTTLLYLGAMPDDMKKNLMNNALPDGKPMDQFETLVDTLLWDQYYPYVESKMKN